MKITWVTRSFLDYRVPVFAELNRLVGGRLTLIYNREVVPRRVDEKVRAVLGQGAIGLDGECRILGPKSWYPTAKGRGIRVVYQPRLLSIIRQATPSVIVTDGFFQWTTSALWLRATSGIPHVMLYERTHHMERGAEWFRVLYRKIVARWIDAVCCSGELCRDYTQSLGIPPGRLTCGHMVADVDGLKREAAHISSREVHQIRKKYNLEGLVFLYVGRLIPLKGVEKLLEAFKHLADRGGLEKMSLLIVGDGVQRSQLEKFCLVNSLKNVRFAGTQDYDTLPAFYRSADAFVIPTLRDNWSLVVPEAMACGLPILCSRYNGCWPELVTANNGWVFDPHDVDDTAEALQKCVATRESLSVMGQKSRDIVSRYTGETAAMAILETCHLAIDRRDDGA